MSYSLHQRVEVRWSVGLDMKTRPQPWWSGEVVKVFEILGREAYHVLLDGGPVVSVGPGSLRAMPEAGGLFALEVAA